MPDFEIVRWDETNSPMHLPYMQQALANRKWANMANYTRLHALATQGGIYLDVDIEVLRTFEALLGDACFFGFEDPFVDWAGCVNNAVVGAAPKHWFIMQCMERLLEKFDGTEEAHLSSPNLTTELLKKNGLRKYGDQLLGDIHLYPTDWFYPYSWHSYFRPEQVSKNTRSIHWFEGSWQTQSKIASPRKWARKNFHLIRWQLTKRRILSSQ